VSAATANDGTVSFGMALRYWLRLGFISFGGPAGQIALMHTDLVERRRWISESRFLHALNYVMVLPGPEAQQLATYIGWLMHGTVGGILAGVLFVLPSLAILCALSYVYLVYGDLPVVAGVLYGIKPAVTAIVVFAAYRIASRALKSGAWFAVAGAAFVATAFLNMPFVAILVAAAIVGYFGARLAPQTFRLSGAGHGGAVAGASAVIDDHSPTPVHARLSAAKLAGHSLVGIAIWAVSEAALAWAFGWTGPLTQMGWFFTKAALLTFGGAYAVLPYVYEGSVETYGWVTAPQMIDGLALGETTPGPLIMIVAFVGFIGAWGQGVLGAGNELLAGVVGASVVTWFTFLPSFVFVLVGGPLVEAGRSDFSLAAPLTGITAAVVGVILNLGMVFAWHVLWPEGTDIAPFAGTFEWPAAVIAVVALVALWRFKAGIISVLGVAAAIGIALEFFN
jgi:chromate transporter